MLFSWANRLLCAVFVASYICVGTAQVSSVIGEQDRKPPRYGSKDTSSLSDAVFTISGTAYTAYETTDALIIGSTAVIPGATFNGQTITTSGGDLIVGSTSIPFSRTKTSLRTSASTTASPTAASTSNAATPNQVQSYIGGFLAFITMLFAPLL
ncbi:MAG: hypothetical protein M1820_005796 [Bogoriella megaspora]|nr:MAG: hypothetical protein M1820_005796 [Bogoriella megaspora]